MGKIDDMRRLREQRYADAETRQAARPARAAPPPAAEAVPLMQPPRPTPEKKTSLSKSGAVVDEQGKCPDCGKTKPISNGVMANHQKGFGKACPGSRKAPVARAQRS